MSWPRLWVKKAIWYHEVIKRSWNLGGSTDNKWFDNILFIIWIRIARDSIAARRTSSLLLRYTNRKRQAAISDSSCTKEEDVWFYDSFRKQQNWQRFRIFGLEYSHERISRVENSLVRWETVSGFVSSQTRRQNLPPTSYACMINL